LVARREADRFHLLDSRAEAAEASGDPMVITRYLYKPDAGEGMTRFNDNQRLHILSWTWPQNRRAN